MEVYIAILAIWATLSLILAAGANLMGDSQDSAVLVVSALLCWAWPVLAPLLALALVAHMIVFALEELTNFKRPEWWPHFD